jgi:hypothetical protein
VQGAAGYLFSHFVAVLLDVCFLRLAFAPGGSLMTYSLMRCIYRFRLDRDLIASLDVREHDLLGDATASHRWFS